MSALEDLDLGRQAHLRQQWAQSFEVLSDIDARDPLGPGDCELAAEAASMLGRGDDEVRLLRRAFLGHADAGSVGAALRCGYWLYKALAWAGEFAQAGAWLAKARRLAEADPDCRECGYLLMLDAELDLRAGRNAEMLAAAQRLADVAREGGDADLAAGAAMTLGSALILNGTIEPGLTHLDEAMVAVTGGELSARSTGMIYCVVIGICQELYDLRRAREWSDALAEWSQAQPDFTGAYRGLCRVHRAAILQLGGGWPGAVREARLACQQLSGRIRPDGGGRRLLPARRAVSVAGRAQRGGRGVPRGPALGLGRSARPVVAAPSAGQAARRRGGGPAGPGRGDRRPAEVPRATGGGRHPAGRRGRVGGGSRRGGAEPDRG